MTGKAMLPEMKMGLTPVNGNTGWLLGNIEQYGTGNKDKDRIPAVLVRDGDKMFRAVTELKNKDGSTRSGEEVPDAYAAKVMAGEDYAGAIERNGKMYSLASKSIKDDSGKVIGALTARIGAEESMSALKKELKALKIGDTGYVYIIALPQGDNKEIKVVMHPNPKLEGKTVSEIEDNAAKDIFTKLAGQKTGEMLYDWLDSEGQSKQKLIVFKENQDLHWVVAAGSFVDEFTKTSTDIRNKSVVGGLVILIVLVATAYLVITFQLAPIRGIVSAISDFGKGDLTVRVSGKQNSDNEIDVIANSSAEMFGNIGSLVSAIKESSTQLKSATDGSARASKQVHQAAEDQAAQTESITAATEQLSVSISSVAEQAGLVRDLATRTVSEVNEGKVVVLNAIKQMRAIGEQISETNVEVRALGSKSSEIGMAVSSIKEIAEQTNLLALNAAIEAARAGEQGRGFAVVADEVRKLAEQSSKAASNIGNILNSVTSGVTNVQESIKEAVAGADAGAKASVQAEAALEKVSVVAEQILQAASEVDNSTREQSATAQNIARSIERMAQSTEETSAAAQTSSNTAGDLASIANKLDNEVSRFKI
jgi:methyl-accepting chemotaxis protein